MVGKKKERERGGNARAIWRLDAALLPLSRSVIRLFLIYRSILVLFTVRALKRVMCNLIPNIRKRAQMRLVNTQREGQTSVDEVKTPNFLTRSTAKVFHKSGCEATRAAIFFPPSHQIPAFETQRRCAPVRARGTQTERAVWWSSSHALPICMMESALAELHCNIHRERQISSNSIAGFVFRRGGSSTEPHSAFLRCPNGATR